MRTRILGSASLLGCIAALFGAGSASAAASVTCLATGTANFNPPMQLLAGTGNVTLSGPAYCVVNGTPVLATVNGSGTYANVICGTFSMDGTWSIPGVGTKPFHYDFVAWQGRDSYGGTMHMVPSGIPPGTCAASATYIATIER